MQCVFLIRGKLESAISIIDMGTETQQISCICNETAPQQHKNGFYNIKAVIRISQISWKRLKPEQAKLPSKYLSAD